MPLDEFIGDVPMDRKLYALSEVGQGPALFLEASYKVKVVMKRDSLFGVRV